MQQYPGLQLNGFLYPIPNWLRDNNTLKASLMDWLKEAILLLIMDRTKTGFWGNTYVYRRHLSKSSVPRSFGSFTGTPMTLIALASSIREGDILLRAWGYPLVSKTLSELLVQNGNYVLDFITAEDGQISPIFEPLRHAAGGLVTTLLFENIKSKNIETLRILCEDHLGSMGWDKGNVVRSLLQASASNDIPDNLRKQAIVRAQSIFEEMIEQGELSVSEHRLWADLYKHGTDSKNQWMTLWVVLPGLVNPNLSEEIRFRFGKLITTFMHSQYEALLDGQLVSLLNSPAQEAQIHVFGSAISLVIWRTLEINNILNTTLVYSQDILNRMLSHRQQLLELSAWHPPGKPTFLEGYLAWTGICLAMSTLGIQLSSMDFQDLLSLATSIQTRFEPQLSIDKLASHYAEVIYKTEHFPIDHIDTLAISAARISHYQQLILE